MVFTGDRSLLAGGVLVFTGEALWKEVKEEGECGRDEAIIQPFWLGFSDNNK